MKIMKKINSLFSTRFPFWQCHQANSSTATDRRRTRSRPRPPSPRRCRCRRWLRLRTRTRTRPDSSETEASGSSSSASVVFRAARSLYKTSQYHSVLKQARELCGSLHHFSLEKNILFCFIKQACLHRVHVRSTYACGICQCPYASYLVACMFFFI
jgi:hypothetical protein